MRYIVAVARQVVEDCELQSEPLLFKNKPKTKDGIYNYGRVFCHHASLALEFKDAWAEGDGERVWRCWKLFMLHFQANGRRKYAWEALRQQMQLASLPPPLAFQLKWGRFVNVHGGKGNNIPCDLYNEHQNKLFKELIASMGANMTEAAITRAAQSVTTLHEVCKQFDKETNVPALTTKHCTKDDHHYVQTVCSVLVKNKIHENYTWKKPFTFPRS